MTQASYAYQQDSSAFYTANAVYTRANTAYAQANSVYSIATAHWSSMNATYNVSNQGYTLVNSAYSLANSAYSLANTFNNYTEGCGASGWWTLPGTGLVGRICVSTTLYSGRPFDAWTTCRAIGARLCRLADFQQICMLTNPFSGSSSGFFSDHHYLQDTYWAWGVGSCLANADAAAVYQTKASYYRCCK